MHFEIQRINRNILREHITNAFLQTFYIKLKNYVTSPPKIPYPTFNRLTRERRIHKISKLPTVPSKYGIYIDSSRLAKRPENRTFDFPGHKT